MDISKKRQVNLTIYHNRANATFRLISNICSIFFVAQEVQDLYFTMANNVPTIKRFLTSVFQYEEEFQVPDNCAGLLIGARGMILQAIQRSCFLKIKSPSINRRYDGIARFKIKGFYRYINKDDFKNQLKWTKTLMAHITIIQMEEKQKKAAPRHKIPMVKWLWSDIEPSAHAQREAEKIITECRAAVDHVISCCNSTDFTIGVWIPREVDRSA